MSVFNSPFNQVFHNPFGSPFSGDASSGTTWTPAEWFLASEQGAWYDPSDFSTMFQDSAGTTPVTAVEQPVGLALDKRLGLVLGVELFANQASAVDNSGGGATIVHTAATRTVQVTVAGSNISYPRLQVDLGMVSGKRYQVSGRIDGSRAGVTLIRLAAGGLANNLAYNSTTGEFSGIQSAAGSSLEVHFDGTLTGTITIASITSRELPGNHASQSTAASRPVLSARKNLTTNSEAQSGNFGGASGGVTAVDGIARPMGTGRVLRRTTGAASYAYGNAAPTANATIAASCYVRRSDGAPLVFGAPTLANSALNDCVLVINGVGITPNATTVEDAGGGWYRLSASAVYTSSSIGFISYNTTVALDITGLQIEYGSAAGTYQRVNTATDYDSVGFPLYLKFDGVDDFLVTNSIDFTSTDKMTVVAGARKLASAEGVIAELSAQYNLNNGSFNLQSRADPNGVSLFVRGSASTSAVSASAFTTNTPAVVTATSKIAADWLHAISVNAGTPAIASSNVGTGNFGNYPIYIGRRAGTSSPFNGHLYQLVVRGALTANLTPGETFTAGKTGITL